MFKKSFIYLFLCILALTKVSAQDDNPFITYDVPSQNLLKFNRFLLNPTFSTVREDKSYFNLLHRNQSATFNDNAQTYFLSYSGRMNDRTGLGLSLFSQQFGAITNYGILANYAYGVKLSDKSNFTFGANVSYYRSGFDRNRATTVDPDDPLLNGLQNSNLLSFQPGINLSYGKFDIGVFAENLFDYNLRTNTSITDFADKTFSGHLQYTHQFENDASIFQGGRLMPLLRVKKGGEKYEVAGKDFILGGSLILDLPRLGWVQGGYDTFFGASAGVGFNLSKRLSLGYTMEKGVANNFNNFGLTHEISFAYAITPNLTEDRVLFEDDNELVENLLEEPKPLSSKDEEIGKLKQALAENNEILAELMFRQDSIEANRNDDLERRFDMVMRMVRRETNGENPLIEEKAKQIYLLNNQNEQGAGYLASKNNKIEATTTQNKAETITAFSDEITSNETKSVTSSNSQAALKDNIAITKNEKSKTTVKTNILTQEKDAFTQITKSNNVKSRKFANLEGVNDGYYLVANVYKNTFYMNKFIDELKAKGIEADYFENKKNGLKYVYLKQHTSMDDALASYKSNIGDKYKGEMWIMNVDNTPTNDNNTAYSVNTQKIKEKSLKYTANDGPKSIIAQDNVGAITVPQVKNFKFTGVDGGYYIIANVFASAKNANAFVKLLNAQGLNASYFVNPENNYRYVYLKKYGSWNNALVSYYSKINNAYDQKMWIMRIAPSSVS
jgi:type IX secretion system PorP/SprF family membrane protein